MRSTSALTALLLVVSANSVAAYSAIKSPTSKKVPSTLVPRHAVASTIPAPSSGDDRVKKSPPGFWPCMDELDKKLIKISIPMIINFSITPLVGANDLFWTHRMGNALAVAGMAASNQVYNTGFWLASFLPSVTSTIVSKEKARGNEEGVSDAVCQALFVATLIAVAGTSLYTFFPDKTLASVLAADAPAMEFAKPYLNIRAFAFLPGLISLVGFSAFRGKLICQISVASSMFRSQITKLIPFVLFHFALCLCTGILDVKTPFTISLFSNMINCVLDPILIFGLGMGVVGNAMSTVLSEVVSAAAFLYLLIKRDLIKPSKIFKLPAWSVLAPLIKGGFALQLRMIAMNITFVAVARVTQSIDKTGVAAAAHEMALQTFQLGGVVLFALSAVAQNMIPSALYATDKDESEGGPVAARATSNRMMAWGLILGTLLGAAQIAALPLIKKATPMQDVRDAAHAPAMLASLLQVINGVVFIGEGVMSGCGDFLFLAFSTMVATAGCVAALGIFPQKHGITGVWMGFAVFNLLRLAGVTVHQFITSSIAPRNVAKAKAKNA
jgi:MATE family multidrug resistance protein